MIEQYRIREVKIINKKILQRGKRRERIYREVCKRKNTNSATYRSRTYRKKSVCITNRRK